MKQIGAGEILSGSFQFVRDHLRAIAIWSAVYLAAMIALQFGMAPFYEAAISGQRSGSPVLSFVLLYILMIAVFIALSTAIFRAALDPDQRDSSYLRVGADELRLFGLLLLLFVLFFLGWIVVAIALGILIAGFAAAGGIAMAVIGYFLGGLGVIALMVFLTVRLASAGPLTVIRKKTMTLGESWRLTRGNFWQLFAAYAVVAVIWIIVGTAIFAITFGGMWQAFAEQMRHPGDPAYQRAMLAAQFQQMTNFGPVRIITMIVGAVLYMVLIALQCGSVAIATKLLIHDDSPSSVF